MISSRERQSPRIVFCALETYSKTGGLQNFNRRVIRNFAERGLERNEPPVRILLLRDHAAQIPPVDGAEITGIGSRAVFMIAALRAALVGAGLFAIGHVNLLPLAAIVHCLRPGLPILLFVHGVEVWNAGHRRKRRWESWLLGAVSRIAAVSLFTARSMAREFSVGLSTFCLLPNATDPLPVSSGEAKREPATVLTIARLGAGDRNKNVDLVIRAIAWLKAVAPGIKYEIAGEGPLRPELEALARDLGVAGAVKFLGPISDAERSAAYERATIFALPSDKEGFGIVYLEAWQHGLPVICSSNGAPKEIVTDGIDGFVVDPKNIPMLAERLSFLLSRPDEARAMGERGRQKIEAKYLNDSFRANLNKIVDELRANVREHRVAASPKARN